jgi:hypothetical protein
MSLGLYNGTITNGATGVYSGTAIGSVAGTQNNLDNIYQIVKTNLYFYWDAGIRTSYPGSGTIMYDLGPNVITGSLTSTLAFNPLAKGCLVYDGTNKVVASTSATLGSATSAYTFGGWVRTNSTGGTNETTILSRGRDGFGGGWSLIVGLDTNGFFRVGSVTLSPSGVGNVLTSTVKADIGRWYNIVGIWNPTVGATNRGLTIYVNGQPILYQLYTGTNLRASTTGWVLGTNAGSAANFTNGLIALAYVYTRALTPVEITQNFNAHKKRFGF